MSRRDSGRLYPGGGQAEWTADPESFEDNVRHAGATEMRTLTPQQLKAFYDRFGEKQDSQVFYEAPAMRELLAHGAFDDARSVFELGSGTGRLALELLQHHLPGDAVYRGIDISTTMVDLACERLARFRARASVTSASSQLEFPLPDGSVDRVVSTYVLDLLSESARRRFLGEARRTLRSDGLLCLAGITSGTTLFSRIVMSTWRWIFALNPVWVGGCRPIDLTAQLASTGWRVHFRAVVVAWGIASEVVIAAPAL